MFQDTPTEQWFATCLNSRYLIRGGGPSSVPKHQHGYTTAHPNGRRDVHIRIPNSTAGCIWTRCNWAKMNREYWPPTPLLYPFHMVPEFKWVHLNLSFTLAILDVKCEEILLGHVLFGFGHHVIIRFLPSRTGIRCGLM